MYIACRTIKRPYDKWETVTNDFWNPARESDGEKRSCRARCGWHGDQRLLEFASMYTLDYPQLSDQGD